MYLNTYEILKSDDDYKNKLDLNEYCIMVFIVYNTFLATMGVGSLKNVLFKQKQEREVGLDARGLGESRVWQMVNPYSTGGSINKY